MSETSKHDYFLDDLNKAMKCGIFTNSQGEILIVYDQKLDSHVQWIEYHTQDDSFDIVYDDGKHQKLGFSFDQKMKDNIKKGTEIILYYMPNKKVLSSQKVSLIIKNY